MWTEYREYPRNADHTGDECGPRQIGAVTYRFNLKLEVDEFHRIRRSPRSQTHERVLNVQELGGYNARDNAMPGRAAGQTLPSYLIHRLNGVYQVLSEDGSTGTFRDYMDSLTFQAARTDG